MENRYLDPSDPFEEFFIVVAYAIRCAYHTTPGFSPAQPVFGRDTVTSNETDVDWEKIRIRKQNQIDKNNTRENPKRAPHEYQAGDLITITWLDNIPKLSIP